MATSEVTVLWTTGLLSILAIVASPLIALWVQRNVEESRPRQLRRQDIFKALWVNRRRQFYIARVDALNMIDVEFLGERKVQDAWDDLRAHYFQEVHPGLNDHQVFQAREEKFATLLFEISQVLKYPFGRTFIRDNVYRPQLHGKIDEMELETRILELLKSDALPVRFVRDAEMRSQSPLIDVSDQREAVGETLLSKLKLHP